VLGSSVARLPSDVNFGRFLMAESRIWGLLGRLNIIIDITSLLCALIPATLGFLWTYIEAATWPVIITCSVAIFAAVYAIMTNWRNSRVDVGQSFFRPPQESGQIQLLPPASVDDLAAKEVIEKSVHIHDVPRGPDHECVIQQKRFIRCQIIGPAVLFYAGGGFTFHKCTLLLPQNEHEAYLFKVPKSRQQVIGPIGVADCHFVGCQMKYIGFAGTKEFLDKLPS